MKDCLASQFDLVLAFSQRIVVYFVPLSKISPNTLRTLYLLIFIGNTQANIFKNLALTLTTRSLLLTLICLQKWKVSIDETITKSWKERSSAGKVSVQWVRSLGGHFACLCLRFEFYGVKKMLSFFKKKMEILLHF